MSSPLAMITGLLGLGGIALISVKFAFPGITFNVNDFMNPRTRMVTVGNCVLVIDNASGRTLNKECTQTASTVVVPPPPAPPPPSSRPPPEPPYDTSLPAGYTIAVDPKANYLRQCFARICIYSGGQQHCLRENVHYQIMVPTSPGQFRSHVRNRIRNHPAWAASMSRFDECISQIGGNRRT